MSLSSTQTAFKEWKRTMSSFLPDVEEQMPHRRVLFGTIYHEYLWLKEGTRSDATGWTIAGFNFNKGNLLQVIFETMSLLVPAEPDYKEMDELSKKVMALSFTEPPPFRPHSVNPFARITSN